MAQRKPKNTWMAFYGRFVQPKTPDEDTRRRESIFNVLLLGLLALTGAAFLYMIINEFLQGPLYKGTSAYVLLVPILLLLAMYLTSRRRFTNSVVYMFVGLYLILGTYALYIYSYALPEGLLTYVLVIIIAGILISNRAAIVATVLVLACLAFLSSIELSGVSHPTLAHLTDPISPGHIVIYFFFFLVIFLVSWLSNRDIERSLSRARNSETALRKERNSLEVKVRQRTRELEKAQVEKLAELQRFAEFGRLSSTLLHDLANPLTAVSLELEQLAETEYSQLVGEARKGITSMEKYVEAARRRLRNESEPKQLNVAQETRHALEALEARARAVHVEMELKLDEKLELFGDGIRFNQIISNLVGNAIDAYQGTDAEARRRVIVTAKRGRTSAIISVEDSGVGIAKADLKHIFEAFYTTKPVERGSGLGLSITKQSVEEDFGGSIDVKSTKGEGTCFTVKLPLQ